MVVKDLEKTYLSGMKLKNNKSIFMDIWLKLSTLTNTKLPTKFNNRN